MYVCWGTQSGYLQWKVEAVGTDSVMLVVTMSGDLLEVTDRSDKAWMISKRRSSGGLSRERQSSIVQN